MMVNSLRPKDYEPRLHTATDQSEGDFPVHLPAWASFSEAPSSRLGAPRRG